MQIDFGFTISVRFLFWVFLDTGTTLIFIELNVIELLLRLHVLSMQISDYDSCLLVRLVKFVSYMDKNSKKQNIFAFM